MKLCNLQCYLHAQTKIWAEFSPEWKMTIKGFCLLFPRKINLVPSASFRCKSKQERSFTPQKMKSLIKDFSKDFSKCEIKDFSKCDQIRWELGSLMENFIFCTVFFIPKKNFAGDEVGKNRLVLWINF